MGSRSSALAALFVVVSASSCRPLLDGGWEGTATCNGDVIPITGVFNENADGELDGVVFIEGLFFGFAGITKGVIEDGERDPDDGTYRFKLETDGDDPAEFDIDMEYEDETFEELEGTVDILDDDGAPVDTCTMKLDLVSVED